jgi:hypothetical protein
VGDVFSPINLCIADWVHLFMDIINMIHSTRKNSKGGGVGFYLKNDLPHKIIPELSHFEEKLFESLTISITRNKKSFT